MPAYLAAVRPVLRKAHETASGSRRYNKAGMFQPLMSALNAHNKQYSVVSKAMKRQHNRNRGKPLDYSVTPPTAV